MKPEKAPKAALHRLTFVLDQATYKKLLRLTATARGNVPMVAVIRSLIDNASKRRSP